MNAVQDLHSFVRPFYSQSSESPAGLSREEIKANLPSLIIAREAHQAIDLQIDVSDLDANVFIAPAFLRHFISPLVDNAVEATGASRNRPVQVTVRIANDRVHKDIVIRVSDDGPGWSGNLERVRSSIMSGTRFTTKGTRRGYGLHHLSRLVGRLGGRMMLADGEPGARIEMCIPMNRL